MKTKIFWAAVIIIIFIFYSLIAIVFQNNDDRVEAVIRIPKGYSANQVAQLLVESGIIKKKLYFQAALKLLGQENNIQAGDYWLASKLTNWAIVSKLTKGETMPPAPLKATFPEGTSIYKMGTILKIQGFHGAEEFGKLTQALAIAELKSEFVFLKDIEGFSLEGYLFPDTYIFHKNISVVNLARLMLKRFKDVVLSYWSKSAKATKYNLHQIITLASIIEKEAQVPGERAIVSSVYHNRLNIKMALDACPTIKYALKDPSKTVLKEQLKVKSPYNTYLNRGLPPGPICNPGLESIKAAIYPAKTNYFYFVAKPDGSHIFSKTLQQHNQARWKVRR